VTNPALTTLRLVARRHGVELNSDQLQHDHAIDEDHTLSLTELAALASRVNLRARVIDASWQELLQLGSALPVIAQLKNGQLIIINSMESQPQSDPEAETTLSILDANCAKPRLETIEAARFRDHWSGSLLLLKGHYRLLDPEQPFSFQWLLLQFFQQKALLLQTFGITMLIHLLAMLPIIYVMIVLDKVVNFEAYSTLYVIAAGVIIGHLFNGLLGYLKQYVALFFVSKLEAKLNHQAFNTIIEQPLSYFHQHAAHNIVQQTRQISTIRQFIVSKLFGTLLDASALILFVPLLLLFSPSLFVIVFIFSLLIALNNIWGAKRQRQLVQQLAKFDNRKQETLSQAVTDIDTVKSLALEGSLKREWEFAAANHTVTSLEQGRQSAISQQISATLQQLMTVVVIFIGVLMVFDNMLSPGVLIGINMLAGKVTGPLVQLVSMTTEVERFGEAVRQLQALLNLRQGSQRRGITPRIDGELTFQQVSFRYHDDHPALQQLDFTIAPNQMVAVVGPSGSGKSTLLRLMQGLMPASEGVVTLDGHDIRTIDSEHLRRHVSMVAQQSRFFNESIRSNLLHALPNASHDRLQWVYRLTGVTHDLAQLPAGDETIIDTSGSNLPTSLLQKLALARALIRNPRILLLDELFAGLSIADEIAIQQQLPEIIRGRTLIVVTHQLYQIVDYDQILLLDRDGRLVEQGTHQQLLAAAGRYATLWQQERQLRRCSEAQVTI